MTTALFGINQWVKLLSEREIPVMRHTVRALDEARQSAEVVSVRKIAALVLNDPLMTARVVRFMTQRRSKRQLQEISTIEHAVMMLGVEPFFHHFAQFVVVEDQLKTESQALLGLVHRIRQIKRAARYASDWAIWRHDLNSEEVTVATTLHDLAELLMWCFAPRQMLAIRARQEASPDLTNAQAQEAVLGFSLIALQAALCRQWSFPEMVSSLPDEAHWTKPRIKNVRLALDLVRHSAHGWDDPALEEDFVAIARLMNIDHDTLMQRLGIDAPST